MTYAIIHRPQRPHRCDPPDSKYVLKNNIAVGTIVECEECHQQWRYTGHMDGMWEVHPHGLDTTTEVPVDSVHWDRREWLPLLVLGIFLAALLITAGALA